MEKIKKIICILLVMALACTMFTGCGKKAEDQAPDVEATEQGTDTEVSEAAPIELDQTVYTSNPIIMCDNETGKITVTHITTDEKGILFHLSCENKSDKKILFSVNRVTVNGYAFDPYFSTTVNPEREAIGSILFPYANLMNAGITQIDKMTCFIEAFTNENDIGDRVFEEACTIYPTGKGDDEIVASDRRHTANEVVVKDENCEFVVLEKKVSDSGNLVLLCYIRNDADDNIVYVADNCLVDGKPCASYWGMDIDSGVATYAKLEFYAGDLEAVDVVASEDNAVEFDVVGYDMNSIETPVLVRLNVKA